MVALALLAGCTGTAPTPAADIEISHVHGLAFAPESNALFVATHHGLVRGVRGDADDATWTWSYVGDERYDLMGFTKDPVARDTFYAGGHPSLAKPGTASRIGLVKSVDGGVTWAAQSLYDEVDIHALSAAPDAEGHLFAWWGGPLRESLDGGKTWRDLPQPPAAVLALAASAGPAGAAATGPLALWAGTTQGLLRSQDGGHRWASVPGVPWGGPVIAVSLAADARVLAATVAADRQASTFFSSDGGATWTSAGGAAAQVEHGLVHAFDANDSAHLFAATAMGTILESRDGGATWATLR